MLWTQSKTLALADQRCTFCFGLGLRGTWGKKETACKCVLRAIFRACHRRFRKCSTAEPRIAHTWKMEPAQPWRRGGKSQAGFSCSAACGRPEKIRYGFRNEEYCADFLSIAKRVLGEKTPLHEIFKWHFLYGADFRAVNRKLGRPADNRNLFHDFYRVEEKLGRAFAECEPYGLWPLDEYFGGRVKTAKAAA